jgi:hypothetical protein
MTHQHDIPVFAIVGHPNEGKSSVVSTLSEDDSVAITPTPGTTVECRTYPVTIDGEEIIRFVDTPGFQSPKTALNWFKRYAGPEQDPVRAFIAEHENIPEFKDECELLAPIARGAGIIYVVDGSRPVRSDDRAEMEILRMTGRPRMAVINAKTEEDAWLDPWKHEFRKHFNMVRVFNAHHAAYGERIDLLTSLKSIDQDWEQALERVIDAFKQDWDRRNTRTSQLIAEMLESCLTYTAVETYARESEVLSAKKRLIDKYRKDIEQLEREVHQQIKKRFKHNIFDYELPPRSIVKEDLFDKRTWQVLGLTSKQLALASAIAGGVAGGVIDMAHAGLSFGVFTAIGGLVGAGAALLGGARMAKAKVVGLKLGGFQIQIGPNENIQFMFVLLDRAFIYYSHIINWAHGRRGLAENNPIPADSRNEKIGYTTHWDETSKKICRRFFQKIRHHEDYDEEKKQMAALIKKTLEEISSSRKIYGMDNLKGQA